MYKEDKEDKGDEKEIFLKLEDYGGGNFVLNAVDKNGERINRGSILSISKDGIMLSHCVSDDIGIALDYFKCVKIINP